MATLFTYPDLPKFRGQISLYLTPLPEINPRFATVVARLFGMNNPVIDNGAKLIIKGRAATLEIFVASGSVWWTKISRVGGEPVQSIDFPNEESSIALANKYLKKIEQWEENAQPVSVTYSETLTETNKDLEPIRVIWQQHVNYRFTLDNLPVWGPGAKIMVSFGEERQVVEFYKFWRSIRQVEEPLELISLETAVALFEKNEAFSELSSETAKVKVNDIALGYFTLPPRETQGALIPVYRFKGVVSTRFLEHYEFTKKVLAVDITPEKAKRMGGIVAGAVPVF